MLEHTNHMHQASYVDINLRIPHTLCEDISQLILELIKLTMSCDKIFSLMKWLWKYLEVLSPHSEHQIWSNMQDITWLTQMRIIWIASPDFGSLTNDQLFKPKWSTSGWSHGLMLHFCTGPCNNVLLIIFPEPSSHQ